MTILLESAPSPAFVAHARLAPIPAGAVLTALKGLLQKAAVTPKLVLQTFGDAQFLVHTIQIRPRAEVRAP